MKRILVIGLLLAMVLTLILPSAAMAARSATFSASGVFTSIDEGNVTETGFDDIYKVPVFNVQDRHIQGQFAPDQKGESNRLNGAFTITYDAVVNGYQIGDFSGILEAKSATFKLSGKSCGVTVDPNNRWRIDLRGIWTGTHGITGDGITGDGSFTAFFYFIPVFESGIAHVGSITESSFVMTSAYDN